MSIISPRLVPAVLRTPADVVTAMAASLRQCDATSDEASAIRCLTGRYRYGDIVTLVDQALFEARRTAVANTHSANS